jgi:hypothetical protein
MRVSKPVKGHVGGLLGKHVEVSLESMLTNN